MIIEVVCVFMKTATSFGTVEAVKEKKSKFIYYARKMIVTTPECDHVMTGEY